VIINLRRSVLEVPLASLYLLKVALSSLAVSSEGESFSSSIVSSSFGGGLGGSITLGGVGLNSCTLVGVKDGVELGVNTYGVNTGVDLTALGWNEFAVGLNGAALAVTVGLKLGGLGTKVLY